MTGSIEVHTELIRNAGDATEGASHRVREANNTLQRVMAANAGGAGNDEYGQMFNEGYGPASKVLIQAIEDLQLHLKQVAAELPRVAEIFEEGERRSVQGITNV
ncbi:hypothetical protein AB4305_24970 [Nocardia sp. 2YAB30]|uniref:hypothetical protein n=1 Tax=Nocardia sp. 2YAB30 TaxID=3233022 RepID=UPI003F953CB1